MSHSLFDGLSVVSLDGAGLTVQQLLDSTLIPNTVTIEDHNVSSTESSGDPLTSNYTAISVIDEGISFDEDDLFQCGRCKGQFSSLDAFMTHKRSPCSFLKDKKESGSIQNSISGVGSVDCVSQTTLNQVTSTITNEEAPEEGESAHQQTEKYECRLSTTVPVTRSVVVNDGEFFNLALEESQVFTLNENLELSTPEGGKMIESKSGTSLFATTTNLVPEEVDPGVVSEGISPQTDSPPKEEEDCPPLPQEDKLDPSNYNHVFFHGRMAKSDSNTKMDALKIRTKHQCSFCSKVFSKNFDLQQHIRSHTGEKPFQCVVCGRAFAQKSNVKKHMVTHRVWPKDSVCHTLPKEPIKKVLSFPPDEPLCHKDLLKEEVLVDDSYVCPFCGKVHGSYLDLRTHMKNHNDQKVYRCIQKDCEDTFLELDEFLSHLRIHEKELQYRCHTCSKMFDSLHALGYHQFEHSIYPWPKKSGPSYFRCTKCMNKYASAEALEHHLKMSRHHFPCKQCHRVFYSERLLRTHLRVHGNAHLFTCGTCCKDFKSEHSLKMHQLIHTGERPFECQVCSLAFNRKDKLKRHMLVHQDKRFKCPFRDTLGCSREFRRNDKLRLHLMSHANSDLEKHLNKAAEGDEGKSSSLKKEIKEEVEGTETEEATPRTSLVPAKRKVGRPSHRNYAKYGASYQCHRTPSSGTNTAKIKVRKLSLAKKRESSSAPLRKGESPGESGAGSPTGMGKGRLPPAPHREGDFIVSYPLEEETNKLEQDVEIIYIPFDMAEGEAPPQVQGGIFSSPGEGPQQQQHSPHAQFFEGDQLSAEILLSHDDVIGEGRKGGQSFFVVKEGGRGEKSPQEQFFGGEPPL